MTAATRCKRGHRLDEANTLVDGRGRRSCRRCKWIYQKHLMSPGLKPALDELYPTSLREIGQQMGLTVSGVNSLIRAALQHLRRQDLSKLEEAVWMKRRAMDARIPNRPWFDVYDSEDDREGSVGSGTS